MSGAMAEIEFIMRIKQKSAEVRRTGFTLAEVMVASAILAGVMAVVLTVFIASQRILENAMADVQVSLELRLLREKLLFHVDENGGLMNARKIGLFTGGDNAVSYVPFPLDVDSGSVISLDSATGKLTPGDGSGWLSSGCIQFDSDATSIFSHDVGDGELRINADVKVENGGRVIRRQRQLIRAQIMSK